MKTARIALVFTLGLVSGVALAQQTTQPAPSLKRTVLQTVDVPGSTTHQVVMAVAEVAPGANAGKHFHHGIEIGYLLDGTVEMEHAGRPTMPAKTGDSFKNDFEAVHDVKNTGKTPARVLAVYVVEKGKPLAEPAK